jgi:non-specific serine/threonine protein kinase
MTPDEAIGYALFLGEEEERHALATTSASVERHTPAKEPAQRLTRREQEVALLVGRGLTNHQVAKELSISERTVHYHLRNIFEKQGFRSRARLAAWVTERGLHLGGGS